MTASAFYKDVADWIDNNVGLSVPVYPGKLRDDYADEVVVVRPTGSRSFRPTTGDTDQKQPRLQVLVRGAPDHFDDAESRARTIFDDLANNRISPYGQPIMANAQPLYIDTDDDGRDRFTINLYLIHSE